VLSSESRAWRWVPWAALTAAAARRAAADAAAAGGAFVLHPVLVELVQGHSKDVARVSQQCVATA
jgi:hypothetical protein